MRPTTPCSTDVAAHTLSFAHIPADDVVAVTFFDASKTRDRTIWRGDKELPQWEREMDLLVSTMPNTPIISFTLFDGSAIFLEPTRANGRIR